MDSIGVQKSDLIAVERSVTDTSRFTPLQCLVVHQWNQQDRRTKGSPWFVYLIYFEQIGCPSDRHLGSFLGSFRASPFVLSNILASFLKKEFFFLFFPLFGLLPSSTAHKPLVVTLQFSTDYVLPRLFRERRLTSPRGAVAARSLAFR
jgi:hypothetical protein